MTHQIANCLKKLITAKAVIMIKVKNYISFLREKDSYTICRPLTHKVWSRFLASLTTFKMNVRIYIYCTYTTTNTLFYNH